MNIFTAIDFESAHCKRYSIYQVGVVRVENRVITKELSILVQPSGNIYWSRFIEIHGINPNITRNAPTFDQIWHNVKPFINNQSVVAHNELCFDFPVFTQTLQY